MQKTLLQIVQEILSDMDSDEVNSHTDTTESLQVANIVQNAYWDIVSQTSFPKMYRPFELTASGSPTQPNLMTLPSGFSNLVWLKYDESTTENPDATFRTLQFLELPEFVNMMYGLDATASNVLMYDYTLDTGDTIQIRCYTDRPPTYYTTVDDNTLFFDSYDSAVDTTLQADKSLAYGEKIPTFTMSDSFVPDLPAKQFTILRNEAKASAFANLKQATNANAERKARRGWITSQKTSRQIDNARNQLNRGPNYGR